MSSINSMIALCEVCYLNKSRISTTTQLNASTSSAQQCCDSVLASVICIHLEGGG